MDSIENNRAKFKIKIRQMFPSWGRKCILQVQMVISNLVQRKAVLKIRQIGKEQGKMLLVLGVASHMREEPLLEPKHLQNNCLSKEIK